MNNCKVPCKECSNRTIPKTCEASCEKWIKYKKEQQLEKSQIKYFKDLERAINRQIWRNSSENY